MKSGETKLSFVLAGDYLKNVLYLKPDSAVPVGRIHRSKLGTEFPLVELPSRYVDKAIIAAKLSFWPLVVAMRTAGLAAYALDSYLAGRRLK